MTTPVAVATVVVAAVDAAVVFSAAVAVLLLLDAAFGVVVKVSAVKTPPGARAAQS